VIRAYALTTAPRYTGEDQGLSCACPLLPGPRVGVADLSGERVLRAGNGRNHHLSINGPLAQLVSRKRPASLKPGRAHVCRPGRPLRGLERESAREMGDSFFHRVPVVRRTPVRSRLGLGRAQAAESLEIRERIVAPVHGEQQLPFFLGAALEYDAAHRVALAADLFRVFV